MLHGGSLEEAVCGARVEVGQEAFTVDCEYTTKLFSTGILANACNETTNGLAIASTVASVVSAVSLATVAPSSSRKSLDSRYNSRLHWSPRTKGSSQL